MVDLERAQWWKIRAACDPVALYLYLPKPEIGDHFAFGLSFIHLLWRGDCFSRT